MVKYRYLSFALVLTVGAAAASPLSAYQRAHMSQSRYASRLLEQLQDLLVLPDTNSTFNAPLVRETYEMVPTGTDVPGVCRKDTVVFTLNPLGTEKPDTKTAMRTAGIELRHAYFFVAEPSSRGMDQAARWKLDRRCANAPKDVNLVYADDPQTARTGMSVLDAMERSAAKLTDSTVYACAPRSCDSLAREARSWAHFGRQCYVDMSHPCISMEWDGAFVVVEYHNRDSGEIEITRIREELYISDPIITGLPASGYIQ